MNFLVQLKSASLVEASMVFLLANLGILFSSIALCALLGRIFHSRRIFNGWEPLRSVEVVAVFGSVIFNAAISVFGWWLWKTEIIKLDAGAPWMALLDCLVMLLFMDLGMYFLHRLAHRPRIYALFHRFHHRHETTNPISLFVLHPLEVIGFGCLMILFLILYSASPAGLMAYLSLNVLWGTLGHSGVEPIPARFNSIPLVRLLGTSTFHAEHHEHPHYNYGFYTLIWDKLFGTLDPEYDSRFRGQRLVSR